MSGVPYLTAEELEQIARCLHDPLHARPYHALIRATPSLDHIIRARMAQAWDEGHRAAQRERSVDPEIHLNPYHEDS